MYGTYNIFTVLQRSAKQGRFQTFTQGGTNWRGKQAEIFWPPPCRGGELAQGGAKEETKYL